MFSAAKKPVLFLERRFSSKMSSKIMLPFPLASSMVDVFLSWSGRKDLISNDLSSCRIMIALLSVITQTVFSAERYAKTGEKSIAMPIRTNGIPNKEK